MNDDTQVVVNPTMDPTAAGSTSDTPVMGGVVDSGAMPAATMPEPVSPTVDPVAGAPEPMGGATSGVVMPSNPMPAATTPEPVASVTPEPISAGMGTAPMPTPTEEDTTPSSGSGM